MEQHRVTIDQAIRSAIAKSREIVKPWAIKENGILSQYLTTKHKKYFILGTLNADMN